MSGEQLRCRECSAVLCFDLDGLCAWCDSARIRRERRAQQTPDERAKERAEVRAEMLARLRRATRAGRSVQIGADDATLLLELLEVE